MISRVPRQRKPVVCRACLHGYLVRPCSWFKESNIGNVGPDAHLLPFSLRRYAPQNQRMELRTRLKSGAPAPAIKARRANPGR